MPKADAFTIAWWAYMAAVSLTLLATIIFGACVYLDHS